MKKEKEYVKFIENVRDSISPYIISKISPSYLSEPRGLYRNKSLHIIKPRSTKEVSDCLRLATKYKIGVVPWSVYRLVGRPDSSTISCDFVHGKNE